MTRLAVLVDWPNAHVPWPCWASIWNSDIRREPHVGIVRPCGPDSSVATNVAIQACLDQNFDEIIMIAADQEIPCRDALARFRSHGKDIVGVLAYSRQEHLGHPLMVYNFHTPGQGTVAKIHSPVQKVDGVPLGCCYIKTSVFRKLPQPWFQTVIDPAGQKVIQSNDLYFFEKCKAHGIEVVVDAKMESNHHHEIALNSASLHRRAPMFVEYHMVEEPVHVSA